MTLSTADPAIDEASRDVMLAVEHVYKGFPAVFGYQSMFKYWGNPPRRTVLHDICLEVRRGELLGLLGANGAGKTTLLKMLATLTIPDRGRILIDGIDVAKQPGMAKSRIGLCTSEERSFYFRLSARANLELFGQLAGLHGAALERRIREVIELVDLGASIDRPFGGFSSGMRQRLTVARALLSDPEILFLDEPTRAVDPVHAEALRRLIRDELVKRRRKTVILATNLLDEAWAICDRVAIVHGGRIVALDHPQFLDRRFRRTLRYQVTLDRVDDALLSRARAVTGFVDAEVAHHPEGASLEVRLEPSDRALTELMQALSSNGATLRDVRCLDAAPFEVFKFMTAPHDDRSA